MYKSIFNIILYNMPSFINSYYQDQVLGFSVGSAKDFQEINSQSLIETLNHLSSFISNSFFTISYIATSYSSSIIYRFFLKNPSTPQGSFPLRKINYIIGMLLFQLINFLQACPQPFLRIRAIHYLREGIRLIYSSSRQKKVCYLSLLI